MANNLFTSPKGTAAYAWLTKADTKFDPEGVFKTQLIVPAKEAQPFIDAIKGAYVEEFGPKKVAQAKLGYKTNEDGTVTFSFKSKKKPKLFDSKGKPITKDLSIGAGSVIKVAGGFGPYNKGANHGVTLYLNSVQVIDYVEFSSGPRFEAEDGYEFDGSGADEPSGNDSTPDGDSGDF
jgi:hypothetical protein